MSDGESSPVEIVFCFYFQVGPGEIEDMIAIVDKNGDGDSLSFTLFFVCSPIFIKSFSYFLVKPARTKLQMEIGDIITSGKIAYSEFRVMMGAFPLLTPK